MDGCKMYIDMISSLVDGELPAEQESRLRAHMEHCPDCRRVYDAFMGISGALSDELISPPEALASGIMFKINMQQGKGTAKHRFAFGRFTAVAACFALIIFGASHFGLFDFLKSGGNNEPSAELESVKSPLPDDQILPDDFGGSSDIDIPDRLEMPNFNTADLPPAESAPPVTSGGDSGSASLFGNGGVEGIPDPAMIETDIFRNDITKLFNVPEIRIYRGKHDPASENAVNVTPFYIASDSEINSKLLDMLQADSLLKGESDKTPITEPLFTLVFPADTEEDPEAKDVTLTVWSVDSKLICQKSGDVPVLFSAKSAPSEFEEYVRHLAV